jgi:hypothetical protein
VDERLAAMVRPLDWEPVEGWPCTKERAPALGGEYEIVRCDGDSGPSVCFRVGSLSFVFILERDPKGDLPTHMRPRQFASLEVAKAAAQADYERRTLSALSPSALAPDMSRELAEALRAIISRRVNGPDTYSILENARSALSRYEEASRG